MARRLSFKDICKRLAELPDTDGAFVAKRPEAVERFVVVHGQVGLGLGLGASTVRCEHG